MRFHDFFYDGQPDAGAAVFVLAVQAREHLEYLVGIFLFEAMPLSRTSMMCQDWPSMASRRAEMSNPLREINV